MSLVTRRQFVSSAPAAFSGGALLSACSQSSDPAGYEAIAAQIRRSSGSSVAVRGVALSQELVRCATLAPSSHNTQCWKFAVADKAITILPDLSRRCPAVDPDDHHVFVSLGCATENLIQAASVHGLRAEAVFDTAGGTDAAGDAAGDAARDAIHVTLEPTSHQTSPLFEAIASRQSTRGDYDGKPLSNEELGLLERAGSSSTVRLLLLTERPAMERVLEHVLQANSAQMADAAFVKELKSWIRFNRAAAIRTRDGLFSVSSGSPAIPTWLGDIAFGLFFSTRGENDKYARQIRSSAGIAIFVGQSADKPHWVEVGRCYERFALQATALGIRNALLNQPVEVQSARLPFAAAIGLSGQRPDLVVRFGRGPHLPPSLRRPVQAVLVG